MRWCDLGQRSQQQVVSLDGDQVADTQDQIVRQRRAACRFGRRTEQRRIHTVVDDADVGSAAEPFGHALGDLFADADHPRGRAVDIRAYLGATAPKPAGHSPGGKGIQPVHRHNKRDAQISCQQHCRLPAGQGGVGVDQAEWLLRMELPHSGFQGRVQESSGTG